MQPDLIYGNQAFAEAAVEAGCRFYAGYPITPQNEIPEHLSVLMPRCGGIFIQAESEIAAINMVYGASAAGARAMTSSSSPGISLKQEGISFLVAAELPAVVINVQRGGPGLGNISASQADYFQATRGGGHGDYKLLVYAPSSVQEAWDLTMKAFDKADEYRTPVMVLSDGVIAQMMESCVRTPYIPSKLPPKDWAVTGAKGRKPNVIRTLYMPDADLAERNRILQEKFRLMAEREVMYEALWTDDAEVVIVAFGISARISRAAVDALRGMGRKVGLLRPITLYPFPTQAIRELAGAGRRFLVVEMNAGQMVDDVRLAVGGASEVAHFGRPGGINMTHEDIVEHVLRGLSQ